MSMIQLGRSDLLKDFGPNTVLRDIITHFENVSQKNGEVVCRVKLNDTSLTEDDESRLSDMSIAEIQKIEIETENPELLLVEVVQDWIKGLPDILRLSDSLSERIRVEGFDSQLATFTHLLDACHFLVSSLESVRIMMLAQNRGLDPRWVSLEAEINKTFSQLMDACQARDGNMVADILEYDLGTVLQNWLQFLPTLKLTQSR